MKIEVTYAHFKSQAIVCKNIYAGFIHFLVGGSLEANVNQLKPCLSMMYKSNGSLIIICLIFNLSLNSYCDRFWLIYFIAIKHHIDLLPIYFYYILNAIFILILHFAGLSVPIILKR